jgi:hypothetical protein
MYTSLLWLMATSVYAKNTFSALKSNALIDKYTSKDQEPVLILLTQWNVKDMVPESKQTNSRGIFLNYAAPLCEAPACHGIELYNDDTGELLCRVNGLSGMNGTNGFIRYDPCRWEGDYYLELLWNTKLTSTKEINPSYGCSEESASWQLQGGILF